VRFIMIFLIIWDFFCNFFLIPLSHTAIVTVLNDNGFHVILSTSNNSLLDFEGMVPSDTFSPHSGVRDECKTERTSSATITKSCKQKHKTLQPESYVFISQSVPWDSTDFPYAKNWKQDITWYRYPNVHYSKCSLQALTPDGRKSK
jgi:hypothetical protein